MMGDIQKQLSEVGPTTAN